MASPCTHAQTRGDKRAQRLQSKSHEHAYKLEKMSPERYDHLEQPTMVEIHDLVSAPFDCENPLHRIHPLRLCLLPVFKWKTESMMCTNSRP